MKPQSTPNTIFRKREAERGISCYNLSELCSGSMTNRGHYINAMSIVVIIYRKIRRALGDGVLDFNIFYDFTLMRTFLSNVLSPWLWRKYV